MGLGLMEKAEPTTYRSVEVCRLAPCSFRQFDYWCRHGLFGQIGVASGSGSRRVGFTAVDVKVARALARLSAAGLLGGGSSGPSTLASYANGIRLALGGSHPTVAYLDRGHGVTVSVSTEASDRSEP